MPNDTESTPVGATGAHRAPGWNEVLVAATLGAIVAGGGAWLAGWNGVADVLWAATTAAGLAPITVSIVRDVIRRKAGVDVIALLAMAAALALGEYFPGAIIAVMYATGSALESFANRRAQGELRALVERAPRVVHRYDGDQLTAPELADVRPRDRLMVQPGEIVPVDGVLAETRAMLDESALTGESQLAEHEPGSGIRSGAVNAGAGFDMFATSTADESTYSGIVRLVRDAQASKAPFVRLADRFALGFLAVTLAVVSAAWALSGDPVRALAVLVVATPCPLILAAPVAIMSGISRAASRGIILKGGGALESLGRARVLLFDKTGTLTAGRPVVTGVEAPGAFDSNEVLRLAASLDQMSPHILASAIMHAARERHIVLSFPENVEDETGQGLRGRVEGHDVAVGRIDWVTSGQPQPEWARRLRRRTSFEGSANVFVAIDGALAGAMILDDPIRPDTARTLRALRRAGIERLVMVTGDHIDVAETVGAAVGVDDVLADRTPGEKVEAVQAERQHGLTVMVGDGINDAPALAAADVGVAMGARGATASSEAADVVLVVDRLDRLIEAMHIARRARGIAMQSVVAGMGLSVLAMIAAAFGFLTPAVGALLQEAIDVAVILNALRALGGYDTNVHAVGVEARLSQRFQAEHTELLPVVDQIRQVADRLDAIEPSAALTELQGVHQFLVERLVPHEMDEEHTLYPALATLLGGDDPTGTMSRGHAEIVHRTRVLGRTIEDLPPSGPRDEDFSELRRILYGLHAILRLHFAQEEEAYLSLFPPAPVGEKVAAAT